MTGNSGLLPAVLTVASVALLSLLTLLCLRCKRKPKVIQEERQIYNQPIFQRGGSQFAVMRSKTVTRTNQISPSPPPSPAAAAAAAAPGSREESDLHEDDQSDYVNVDCVCGSLEDNYVKPIGESVYVNEKAFDCGLDPGLYGNVFPSMVLENDDDDYENSEFLNHAEDEPDYENGECA